MRPDPEVGWQPAAGCRIYGSMHRSVVRLFASAIAAGGLWAAEPEPPSLPPLNGELAGRLVLPRIAGFPPFDWRVKLRPADSARLAFDATASAPGVELQVEVTLPRGDSPGGWRIASAKIDAAHWWRLTAELGGVKSLPPDFEFTGQFAVNGSGSWRGGEVSGLLHATLSGAAAHSSLQNWSASGLTIESDLALTAGRGTLRAAQVRVETVQVAGLTAHDFVLDAVGAGAGGVAIQRAEIAALGGQITLAPFTVDPSHPAFKTTVDFPHVVLGDVVPLLPQALKEAQGRVAGRVLIDWNAKDGLVSAEGKLATIAGETAVLRLAGSPGLLTGHVPERIAVFLGISLKNPATDTLRRVELGEDALIVDNLTIELFSARGTEGRTAEIRVVGRPTNDRDLKHVTLTVNVAGPLDQVLRLGVAQHAKLKVGAAK